MFSKEESKRLRHEFWTAFGKSFPRKWILYQTKIKDFSLKFHFDTKSAAVSMDVEDQDLDKRIALWEKLISLRTILTDDYLPNIQFNDSVMLENGKNISRIWVQKEQVSIHNKNTWRETMEFLNENMVQMEEFFEEYGEILSDS